MSKMQAFESSISRIRSLEHSGNSLFQSPIYEEYQRRNSFGFDLDRPIYRVFQREYLDQDISNGLLTLPRASSREWNDSLENPLSDVMEHDPVSGSSIDLGSLTASFHALCWCHRATPLQIEWDNFSHGRSSDRIATTARKLLDRLMLRSDSSYMHRVWLVEVDYLGSDQIRAMKNPMEAYSRLESQNSLLALSAAIVSDYNSHEDEVRLLIDSKIQPTPPGWIVSNGLLQIPFDWHGVIDERVQGPI